MVVIARPGLLCVVCLGVYRAKVHLRISSSSLLTGEGCIFAVHFILLAFQQMSICNGPPNEMEKRIVDLPANLSKNPGVFRNKQFSRVYPGLSPGSPVCGVFRLNSVMRPSQKGRKLRRSMLSVRFCVASSLPPLSSPALPGSLTLTHIQADVLSDEAFSDYLLFRLRSSSHAILVRSLSGAA